MEPVYIILIILGSCALLVVIGVLIWYFVGRKEDKKPLDILDVSKIEAALGGSQNIISVAKEAKRIKVSLNNKDLILPEELKKMHISAFLVGNDLKMLVKQDADKVFEALDKSVGEIK